MRDSLPQQFAVQQELQEHHSQPLIRMGEGAGGRGVRLECGGSETDAHKGSEQSGGESARRQRRDRPDATGKRGVRRLRRQLGESLRDLLGACRLQVQQDRSGEGGDIQHAQRAQHRDTVPAERPAYHIAVVLKGEITKMRVFRVVLY